MIDNYVKNEDRIMIDETIYLGSRRLELIII
jgi:hypothetical protein